MFLNHFKNFYPGVGRDRLIEVAAHFRIVASLGYLLVNSSVKRNQESLLRSRQKSLVPYRQCSANTPSLGPMLPVRSSVDTAICSKPLARWIYGD